MPLAIAQLGQPVLRRPAEPMPPEAFASAEFRQLLQAMQETLTETGGVGLAAPQVFVSRRVFLAVVTAPAEGQEESPPAEVFINPRLVTTSPESEAAWEGCLSFPELLVLVSRPQRVRIGYLDAGGGSRELDLEGFPARVVQHEYDHLEGILTIDRACSTRDIIKASEIAAVLRDRAPQEETPGPDL
jgi:peptide deformylase